MSAVPELRPLSVGEILDVALKIWRRHFPALAKIVLFVVAPVQVLSSLLLVSAIPNSDAFFDPSAFDPTTNTTTDVFGENFDGGDAAAFFAAFGLVTLLSGLAFVLSSAAALRAITVAYLGGTPDWKESLRGAVNRLGSLVWLTLLMSLGVTLGFVFCLVPGIWLAVSWSLAFVALVAEDLSGTAALRRSYDLVRGRFWATFGVLLIAFLLNAVVDQIVAIPFAIGSFFSADSIVGFSLSAVANIISDVVTTPFVAAVFVLVYFDLRVRKEGFDLQLMAQAMGQPEGLPSGSPYGPPPGPYGPPPAGPYGGQPQGPPGGPSPQWPPPPSDWPPPGSSS
jgi:hypothetical protein